LPPYSGSRGAAIATLERVLAAASDFRITSIQLSDLGQEFAARAVQPNLVLLQAAQDSHVALSKELAAEPVGTRLAGTIAALAHVVLCMT
jgi:hypothetical protein